MAKEKKKAHKVEMTQEKRDIIGGSNNVFDHLQQMQYFSFNQK